MKGREQMNKRKALLCSIIVIIMTVQPLSNVLLIRSEGATGKTLTLSQAVTFAMNVSRIQNNKEQNIFKAGRV